jgi:hypothetical protein
MSVSKRAILSLPIFLAPNFAKFLPQERLQFLGHSDETMVLQTRRTSRSQLRNILTGKETLWAFADRNALKHGVADGLTVVNVLFCGC